MADGTLRQYISGKRYPDLDFLAAIANAGNVNLLWLATGEGEKHPPAAGTIREGSSDYAAKVVDETVLTRAVEAVEEAVS